jgi:hypothetical protein
MTEADHLLAALDALPESIRGPLATALVSRDFAIGAWSWESELAVCPIAAAAITAGVWKDDALVTGASEWGTPDGPSEVVADFAAWFDLCAEEYGLDEATWTVRGALKRRPARPPRAPLGSRLGTRGASGLSDASDAIRIDATDSLLRAAGVARDRSYSSRGLEREP